MIVVIIAGGSGTRLWPLSTKGYPKHLLKLTNDKSMLQNTFSRVSRVTSLDKIFVITEISHVEHVYEQLAGLKKENILIEPGRRGTASCLIYALSEIKKRGLPDEPILFHWADHLIRDEESFASTILRAGEVAESEQKLVFVGIDPTYPATCFGYVERGEPVKNWQEVYEVVRFKEKPDQETAQEFLASGRYAWNTGYLVGTTVTFERELKMHSEELWQNYQKLLANDNLEKTYLDFENNPLEYIFSEKVKDGLVILCSFDWMDVGSFNDLHDVSAKDEKGNHVKGEKIIIDEVTNSFIRNETEVPLAVIGLDNVVVVNSPNGVLVVNKNFAQKVSDVAKKIQSN